MDIRMTTIDGPNEETNLEICLFARGRFCEYDAVKDVASAVIEATTRDDHAFFMFLFTLMKFLPRLNAASYRKLIDSSALKQSSVKRVQTDNKLAKLKIDAKARKSDVQIPVQL